MPNKKAPRERRFVHRCITDVVLLVRGGGSILLLDNARRLAAAATQVIQLGAPHLALAYQLDGIDHRRIQRKYPLDALAVRNLAHCKALVQSATGPADA